MEHETANITLQCMRAVPLYHGRMQVWQTMLTQRLQRWRIVCLLFCQSNYVAGKAQE